MLDVNCTTLTHAMLLDMFIRILAAVAFVLMVTVNALANILPINGVSTGVISDSYPNLFAPAGVTFSIWGVIYLLLGVYTVFQLGLFGRKSSKKHETLLDELSKWFLVSSLINSTWIFAWHYLQIGLAALLLVSLLIVLIKIAELLRTQKLAGWENWVISTPFFVYFGWVTVATSANITIWLVSLGWNGFGLSDVFWTVAILLVGAAIGIARLLRDRKIEYGLVCIWAYFGIGLKHYSPEGFNGQYPAVLVTVFLSIAAFIFAIISLKTTKNINTTGRIIRGIIGLVLLGAALYFSNPLLALAGIFSLIEAGSSWCVVNQLLGRNECPLPKK